MNHIELYGIKFTYGCIHKLENECSILNEKLGDCGIQDDITNITLWRCPFLFSRRD